MNKILIAPDSFKGSLTANQFCEIAAEVIKGLDPTIVVDSIPMADGGEGTVDALVCNTGGRIVTCGVRGPLGRDRIASYGILGNGKTAVIEMAESSGLALLETSERNPMLTTTYGVGELILDAMDKGCTELLIGIGGSATNDCGMGMLSALGYVFYDEKGQRLQGIGENLSKVDTIDVKNRDQRLEHITVNVACDVENPLTGKQGAAYIYGPQKGADLEMVEALDAGMSHFAKKIRYYFEKDVVNVPGAGAAGGLGAGLMAFLDAKLTSGFTMVSTALNLEEMIKLGGYSLIITGEGQMNHQTLNGKLPYGIAKLGMKYQVPVVGIVGSLGQGYEPMLDAGMLSVFSIMNRPMTLETAFVESESLLRDTVRGVIRLFGHNN